MRWIAKTSTLSIRPYQMQDRSQLMKIAADTAFFGEPLEIYLDDRHLFEDSFYRYYTDYEPEHAWVAIANQEVVGFLTGCFDTRRQIEVTRYKLMPKVYWRFLRGKYKIGKKTIAYYRKLRQVRRPENLTHVDLRIYPAHLHINVDQQWRGCGIGQRLIQIYLDQLIYAGVIGVHLGTTSENEAACKLYTKMGFELLESKETPQWKDLIDNPVYSRAYGLKLPKVLQQEETLPLLV